MTMGTNEDRFRERTEYYSRLSTGYIIDFINGRNVTEVLREAMLYGIEGGKRLRPALLMGSCMIFDDGIEPEILPYAAAMEMIGPGPGQGGCGKGGSSISSGRLKTNLSTNSGHHFSMNGHRQASRSTS